MKAQYKALGHNDMDELLNNFSLPMRSHSRRVAVCSAIMAEYAEKYLHWVDVPAGINLAVVAHLGGLCHDVGKLLLPVISAADADYMRHPVYGAELLEKYKRSFFTSEAEAQLVQEMVRYHHERPDGGGFPYGLQARSIPLTAGICAVADSLDHRIVSGSESSGSGMEDYRYIKENERVVFYENAVDCFERAWPRLVEQYDKWGFSGR